MKDDKENNKKKFQKKKELEIEILIVKDLIKKSNLYSALVNIEKSIEYYYVGSKLSKISSKHIIKYNSITYR